MAYLLDSSSAIYASRHLSFATFPSLWEWLGRSIGAGKIVIIKQVYEEVTGGDDELAEWFLSFEKMLADVSLSYTEHLGKMELWIREHYTEDALKKFLSRSNGKDAADSFLIALALQNRGDLLGEEDVIVTEEVSAPQMTGQVRIPDVCRQFDIRCINFRDLLAEEKVVFSGIDSR